MCPLAGTLFLFATLSGYAQDQSGPQKNTPPDPQKVTAPQPASATSLPATSLPTTSINDALRLYRRGGFDDAAEKYEAVLKQSPTSAEAYAGLVRCYLKAGKVQEAYKTVGDGIKAAPDSQVLHVALGEVYFRQGKMHDAEQEFLGAANSEAPDARAYLGLARISKAISMHGRARRMLERAHELDPGDPEIEWRWLSGLERPARIQALEADIAAAGTAEDAQLLEEYKDYLESLRQQEKRREEKKQEEKRPGPDCTLVAGPTAMRTYLWPLFIVPPRISGYGLDFKINGRQMRLLLDTGASGILLNPRAAERAGIIPTAQSKMVGMGGKGEVDLYEGYADSVRIGALDFKNCPVQVSAREATDHDGLVGADLFAHYLVTIDYPARELKLSQLPKRPDDRAQAAPSRPGETGSELTDDYEGGVEDRYIAPEMQSYTTIYRFGHILLVPTVLNDGPSKLFLIDTGSDHSYISPEAAREVTKLQKDEDIHVVGLPGRVKNVFRADKATLSFGRYKQDNQDLIAFDLSNLSQDAGTEISGTLGFALLRVMKITIDYRDGLVDFSYDFTRVH